ncbi:MAG TPA: MinD/ParA family protein [Synergistaceae bacterium]|nr:MinD/ParA family protein [Synergistaceae bacterium]
MMETRESSPLAKGPIQEQILTPDPFSEDQAALLRSMVSAYAGGGNPLRNRGIRTIAVVSGKGGVGKTNLSVNLALALGSQGWRVAVMDADLGLANVDILFGMMPKYNLGHVIRGQRDLEDILVTVEERVMVIPGGAGVQELADLDQGRQAELIEKLAALEGKVDILMVDTGAGIHRNIISFALASDTTVLLTSPEPTSIRDAYGVLKSLVMSSAGGLDVRLLVNMAMSDEEAEAVAERIQMAANQFLGISVPYIGQIPWDKKVRDAVQERRPFFSSFPGCRASLALLEVAGRLVGPENITDDGAGRGVKSFLFRLTRRLGLGR